MAIAERIGGRRGPQGIQGEQGPAGEQGPPGTSGGVVLLFGGGTLGTSGTRYVYPGYNASGTSGGLKRMRSPCDFSSVRIYYTDSAGGSGTGTYTVTFCTVESDVATATALTATFGPGDRDLPGGYAEAAVSGSAGQEIALQLVVDGTVTSPADGYFTVVLFP